MFLVTLLVKLTFHFLFQVTISPQVPSKKVCRDVINQLVATYKDSHLGKRKLAYDGGKSCYSAGSLPFESKDFVVTFLDKDRPERYHIDIKYYC